MAGPGCCDKIHCCRVDWFGFDVPAADNMLTFETNCTNIEDVGILGLPNQQEINITITGCDGFNIECSLVKSETVEGLYVAEGCGQCAMLQLSNLYKISSDPEDPEAPLETFNGCGLVPPEEMDNPLTLYPQITQFRVFPIGVLGDDVGDDTRCEDPYVYGTNPPDPDDGPVVWAPPDTWDCSEPVPGAQPVVHLDEWKKNVCHLVVLPSKSGIPFPGRYPYISPVTCEPQYNIDLCQPPAEPPYPGGCIDFDHYCMHVAVVNGESHIKDWTAVGEIYTFNHYDYGPAICRCPQCCPEVTLSWAVPVEEMMMATEGGESRGLVYPPGLSREEKRAMLREHRKTNPVMKVKPMGPKPKEPAYAHARCEHLPILPEKRGCGGCWQKSTFNCPKVGRQVKPKKDCGPQCRFYEPDPDAPPASPLPRQVALPPARTTAEAARSPESA